MGTTSKGSIWSSADCRHGADISGWHIPAALSRRHCCIPSGRKRKDGWRMNMNIQNGPYISVLVSIFFFLRDLSLQSSQSTKRKYRIKHDVCRFSDAKQTPAAMNRTRDHASQCRTPTQDFCLEHEQYHHCRVSQTVQVVDLMQLTPLGLDNTMPLSIIGNPISRGAPYCVQERPAHSVQVA